MRSRIRGLLGGPERSAVGAPPPLVPSTSRKCGCATSQVTLNRARKWPGQRTPLSDLLGVVKVRAPPPPNLGHNPGTKFAVVEQEHEKTPHLRGFRKADDGLRTRDLRLGKPTLYQLSYVRRAGRA